MRTWESTYLRVEERDEWRVIVAICYVRRAECPMRCPDACEHRRDPPYQVWVIFPLGTGEQLAIVPALVHDSRKASELIERLQDAIAETVADDAVGLLGTWSNGDGVPYLEALDFLGEIPDGLHQATENLFATMLQPKVPVPVSVFAGDVAATFMIEPIAQPIGSLIRVAEYAGIAIGLLTGIHALALACVKRLAVSSMASEVAAIVSHELKMLSEPTTAFELLIEGSLPEETSGPSAYEILSSLDEDTEDTDSLPPCGQDPAIGSAFDA
jgi:hypothetical protein